MSNNKFKKYTVEEAIKKVEEQKNNFIKNNIKKSQIPKEKEAIEELEKATSEFIDNLKGRLSKISEGEILFSMGKIFFDLSSKYSISMLISKSEEHLKLIAIATAELIGDDGSCLKNSKVILNENFLDRTYSREIDM